MQRAAAAAAAAALLLPLPAAAGPCDILGAAVPATPCVAAHSMVRALYAGYAGPLYQLRRTADNATADIHALAPGGFANASAHDAFCAGGGGPAPPPPPPPQPGFPPLGATVTLSPTAQPGLSFRHCYSAGYVTPTADATNGDHLFVMVEALSGAAYGVSFQPKAFPGQYLAVTGSGGEAGRLGIAPSPAPALASWVVAAAPGGGYTLTLQAPGLAGQGMAVGGNLTGQCAASYAPPAAGVYLALQPSAWSIAAGAGPVPLAACVVATLYDQTGRGNHLLPAGPGINNPAYDKPVNATRHPIAAGGHRVYGAYFEGGMGYRAYNTSGVARGNDPETLYMVTSGTHVNSGCCFDMGNRCVRRRRARAPTTVAPPPHPLPLLLHTPCPSENRPDDPSSFCDGCMEAVYFGTSGGWCGGGGPQPTVLADLENGLWGCDVPAHAANNSALPFPFVMAMLKGGVGSFALKGGDATSGTLATFYSGPRPRGYEVMHKTGAIILGVGGDNVASRAGSGIPGTSVGTMYEAVMTSGYTSDATDEALAKDIASAQYGQ